MKSEEKINQKRSRTTKEEISPGKRRKSFEKEENKSRDDEPETNSPIPTLDPLSALAQLGGTEHILEGVWRKLDWRSLKNATLVNQR